MAGIFIKSEREIGIMREAGRIVALTLAELRRAAAPGRTTADLDRIAEQTAKKMGAAPAFKGYRGFPASLCVSINDEIVHGIPSPKRVLREGDIISLDFGAIYRGFYGDAAITVPVGQVSQQALELLKTTEESLDAAIGAVRAGVHLGDVSHAVEEYVVARGFSVVRQYVGHGIGRAMHEKPQIPNFGVPGTDVVLRPGMALAIEPMVNTGTWETRTLADNWTVVTADGGLSAHFEHTVIVREGEPTILTVI